MKRIIYSLIIMCMLVACGVASSSADSYGDYNSTVTKINIIPGPDVKRWTICAYGPYFDENEIDINDESALMDENNNITHLGLVNFTDETIFNGNESFTMIIPHYCYEDGRKLIYSHLFYGKIWYYNKKGKPYATRELEDIINNKFGPIWLHSLDNMNYTIEDGHPCESIPF